MIYSADSLDQSGQQVYVITDPKQKRMFTDVFRTAASVRLFQLERRPAKESSLVKTAFRRLNTSFLPIVCIGNGAGSITAAESSLLSWII